MSRDLLVTIIDVEDLPTVGKIPLLDVFGESAGSVTIDGDVYLVTSVSEDRLRQKWETLTVVVVDLGI